MIPSDVRGKRFVKLHELLAASQERLQDLKGAEELLRTGQDQERVAERLPRVLRRIEGEQEIADDLEHRIWQAEDREAWPDDSECKLRAGIWYVVDGEKIAIVETEDIPTIRALAGRILEERDVALAMTTNDILGASIIAESEAARKVLQVAGIDLR